MSSNSVSGGSAATRQRLLLIIAALAVVAAWRERAFNRNRSKYGAVQAPEPRS
jgi:hypothetical protein